MPVTRNITRFAPSPNGPLHLGHAYSAIVSHDLARQTNGEFLLRIEDIDGPRSKPALAGEFRADLAWLGLEWRETPAQSARLDSYRAAAEVLKARGLLYPCVCTRKDIAAAQERAGITDGRYPGTCRDNRPGGPGPAAWRIDMALAALQVGPLSWVDELAGEHRVDPAALDDAVLLRKDAPASYHLAATLDDAADGVTLVTRGRDLLESTPYHRILQALLGLPVPIWHHHPLLLDETGEKLAKRRGSGMRGRGLADRRKAGEDGLQVAEMLRAGNLPAGISLSTT